MQMYTYMCAHSYTHILSLSLSLIHTHTHTFQQTEACTLQRLAGLAACFRLAVGVLHGVAVVQRLHAAQAVADDADDDGGDAEHQQEQPARRLPDALQHTQSVAAQGYAVDPSTNPLANLSTHRFIWPPTHLSMRLPTNPDIRLGQIL